MFNNTNNQFNNNNMMFFNNQMNNLSLNNQIGGNPMNQNNNMNFNNNINMNNQNFQNTPNPNFMNQNIMIQNQTPFNNNNNNNFNQNAINQNNNQNDFIKNLIFPHKAGLKNLGKSSYLNSTIECLSNIKGLSKKILQKFGNYDLDNQPLCAAFSGLLCELFHTREKSIEPRLFKQIIGKLNPLFEGNNAADAKDLLFFIIDLFIP